MNELLNSSYAIYFLSFMAFFVILLIIEGGYLFWKGLQVESSLKVNRRLRALSAGGVQTKKGYVTSAS